MPMQSTTISATASSPLHLPPAPFTQHPRRYLGQTRAHRNDPGPKNALENHAARLGSARIDKPPHLGAWPAQAKHHHHRHTCPSPHRQRPAHSLLARASPPLPRPRLSSPQPSCTENFFENNPANVGSTPAAEPPHPRAWLVRAEHHLSATASSPHRLRPVRSLPSHTTTAAVSTTSLWRSSRCGVPCLRDYPRLVRESLSWRPLC